MRYKILLLCFLGGICGGVPLLAQRVEDAFSTYDFDTFVDQPEPISFEDAISTYLDEGDARVDSLLLYARRLLGTRYRSGGKGPLAFDCSGFTGYVGFTK